MCYIDIGSKIAHIKSIVMLGFKMKRKNYIDNLRLYCVLLLIPYHAAMAWNCWGEDNFIRFGSDRMLSSFITAVSPWYMPLLFVLAGISAKYSLQKRSVRQFVQERVQKLIVPFIIGTIAVMPVLAFFADKTNCGYSGSLFSHYYTFFTKYTDLTGYDGGFGVGHLWFLLYLFVISMTALALDLLSHKKLSKADKDTNQKNGHLHILSITIILFISMTAMPVKLGSKSILSYLLLYQIGYYILSNEAYIDRFEKYRHVYYALWILSSFLNVYLFIWMPSGQRSIHFQGAVRCFISSSMLNTAAMYLSGCFGILSLLIAVKRMLSKTGRLTASRSAESFFIYILHFPWVVLCEYCFSFITADTCILFTVSVICSFIFTYISCRLLRALTACKLSQLR